MGVKMTVRTRFKVNGKEYGSLEELPPDIRDAYEKAMATQGGSPLAVGVSGAGKISFNGREYASLDEMPLEERRVFEGAMAAVERAPGAQPGAAPMTLEPPQIAVPIVPGGSAGAGSRWIRKALVLLALLAGFLLLIRALASR